VRTTPVKPPIGECDCPHLRECSVRPLRGYPAWQADSGLANERRLTISTAAALLPISMSRSYEGWHCQVGFPPPPFWSFSSAKAPLTLARTSARRPRPEPADIAALVGYRVAAARRCGAGDGPPPPYSVLPIARASRDESGGGGLTGPLDPTA